MWTVGYVSPRFARFLRSLAPHKQAVARSAVENVLLVVGINICQSEWGKPLGGGLFEFRIRRRPQPSPSMEERPLDSTAGDTTHSLALRVFCAFYGDREVALFGGYDKGRDPSLARQRTEINQARKELRRWRENIQ